jgi:hypothetical protein
MNRATFFRTIADILSPWNLQKIILKISHSEVLTQLSLRWGASQEIALANFQEVFLLWILGPHIEKPCVHERDSDFSK